MKVFGRAATDGRGLSFFSLPMLPRLKRQNNTFQKKTILSSLPSYCKIILKVGKVISKITLDARNQLYFKV
jgi:hypothetical protein